MAAHQPCDRHESAYTDNLDINSPPRLDETKRMASCVCISCLLNFFLSLYLYVGDYLYVVKILHAKDFLSSTHSSLVPSI